MSIRDVQLALNALGFDAGPDDGIWGKRTEAAFNAAFAARQGPAEAVDAETTTLIAELRRDEGQVLHAYADSLGYLTIGIGRLIDKRKGGGISEDEAAALLANDIGRLRKALDRRFPWWRKMDPVRQRAVQNMAFQIGVSGLAGATYDMIRDGKYAAAAARLRGWKWAKQTPARANRVIRMIETGTTGD